jgi:uncharacterized membrane protein
MNEIETNSNPHPTSDAAPRWSLDQDQQHVIARLEGFTDVIFGFAIFTAAMNLKVPENARDLVDQKFEFFVFFCNFVFITSLWWQQHRIFAAYFKPTPMAIIGHFAFLGCTAMLSYPLQLYMQHHKSLVVIQTYLAGFATVYFLQTLLIFMGRRNLQLLLTPEQFARGAVFGAISAALGVVSLISFSLTFVIGSLGGAAMSLLPIAVLIVRRVAKAWAHPNATNPPGEIEKPGIADFDVH